ncbi:hypothetical protein GW915_00155 [bacterium]|nr:hypothetical protein [bacterium]
MSRFLLLFLFIFFGQSLGMARPREDRVDFSKLDESSKKKKKVLLDRDITFTNEDIEKKMDDPATMQVRYDVLGRSRPGRGGKPLERFLKGSLVRALFFSKDKRWVAVESMKTNKKRWLPRASLPSFKDDIFVKKK